MKKTLVALAVTAFAASASAVTIYENEGTKFEVDGRLHVVAQKNTTKKGNDATEGHSSLANDGSRVRFTATHALNDDVSAFGRVELRFDGKNSTYDKVKEKNVEKYETGSAGWGNVRTHHAFVGLTSKSLASQVTFGKQLLIGDDIGRIGLDNHYGVDSSLIGGQTILTEKSNSAVEYRFTGVKGLTLATNYSFADTHDTDEAYKADYGVGAVYGFDVAEGQKASVSLGYSHTDFQHVTGSAKKDKDGVYGGVNFENALLKVGVDGGRAVLKNTAGDKTNTTSFIRTGLKVNATDKIAVYGNYGYLTVKDAAGFKDKAHRFMLGTEYQVHKYVKTYVEGKFDRITFSDGSKQKDKGIAAGLVVFW